MVGAELYKIAKDGNAGDLGQALDLGRVGRVEEFQKKIDSGNEGNANDLVGRHLY